MNYELITSIFAGLITLGVGRIWYLQNRHDAETTNSVKNLYKSIADQNKTFNEKMEWHQKQISENNKTIAICLEQIKNNAERDSERTKYIMETLSLMKQQRGK